MSTVMSTKKSEITRKQVDDMLIASIRFRGEYEEAGENFGKLEPHCEGLVCGPPFCLYHYGTSTKGNIDIEVCFPVIQAVEANGVKSRILKGGQALSILHYGSYQKLPETYKKLFDYIEKKCISVQDTEREIYVEWHPDDPEKYVTEIQVFLDAN